MKRWLCVLLLSIAAIGALGQEPASEVARLREENRRLANKISELEERERRVRLWLGSLIDEKRDLSADQREILLLTRLDALIRASDRFAVQSCDFYDEMRRLIARLPLPGAEKTRIELRLEALETLARRLVSNDDVKRSGGVVARLKNTRLLEVNPALRVALLEAGALDGIAPGVIFRDAEGGFELRVVEVREKISAATVMRGDFGALRPGMTFSPISGKGSATILPPQLR